MFIQILIAQKKYAGFGTLPPPPSRNFPPAAFGLDYVPQGHLFKLDPTFLILKLEDVNEFNDFEVHGHHWIARENSQTPNPLLLPVILQF